MLIQDIEKVLRVVREKSLYPDIHRIDSASTNPEIIINGKKVLIFCSNNYLGTATDERIKEEIIKAVSTYGMGSGGSRLVSGNTAPQELLEKKVADFKETEAAITFATGYMANTGIIPALFNLPNLSATDYLKDKFLSENKGVIFSDELNHASIVDGARLSKAERVKYRHCDVEDLRTQLKKKRGIGRKLIITDGVFSMDGDITPLPEIMNLAEEYGAAVMVDDAHATGILGIRGKGTAEYFGLKNKPEITMGTFTKVFGGLGGFVAGSQDLIDYLKVTARTYIFSAPIPPAIVVGIIKSMEIVSNEPERRLILWKNINHFKNRLEEKGFNTLRSETQIIPIFIGDEHRAIKVSRKLLERGFFVPAIRWPAVEHGKSRLRITLMTSHTIEQIDELFDALVKIRDEIKF